MSSANHYGYQACILLTKDYGIPRHLFTIAIFFHRMPAHNQALYAFAPSENACKKRSGKEGCDGL